MMTKEEYYSLNIVTEGSFELLSDDDGGRNVGVKSGYRPDIVIDSKYYMGTIELLETDELNPGEVTKVRYRISSGQS